MSSETQRALTLKVGDRIRFKMRGRELQARVIKYPGMIRAGYAQTVCIKHHTSDSEWELPAAMMRRVK